MSQASGIEKCLNYLTNQIDLKQHDQQKSQQKIQQIESELTKQKAQYDKFIYIKNIVEGKNFNSNKEKLDDIWTQRARKFENVLPYLTKVKQELESNKLYHANQLKIQIFCCYKGLAGLSKDV